MIATQFDAKLLAVIDSEYKNKDGKMVRSCGVILLDPDGFEKAPTVRIDVDTFEKLKLDDLKVAESFTGKTCSFKGGLVSYGDGLTVSVSSISLK